MQGGKIFEKHYKVWKLIKQCRNMRRNWKVKPINETNKQKSKH